MTERTPSKKEIITDIHYFENLVETYEVCMDRAAMKSSSDPAIQARLDEEIETNAKSAAECRLKAQQLRELLKSMVANVTV